MGSGGWEQRKGMGLGDKRGGWVRQDSRVTNLIRFNHI